MDSIDSEVKIHHFDSWAGEKIIQRIPPMPIYSLILAENLMGRFDSIIDPMPGKFDVAKALNDIQVSDLIIADSDLDFMSLDFIQTKAAICSPDPRETQKIISKCLTLGMEYIAIFGRATQLSGLRRYKNLYSKYPPDRVYILSEAWAQNRRNRGGSDGAWNPATWIVYDGKGLPAIENRPKNPTLHWISEKTSKG